MDKICWVRLSKNPSAIHLLKANLDKIDWGYLSENPSAIQLLEENMDKICWARLSTNPSAIHLIEADMSININGFYCHCTIWENPAIFEDDYMLK